MVRIARCALLLMTIVACSSPADTEVDAAVIDGAAPDAQPLQLEVVVDQLVAPFAVTVAGAQLFFSDSGDQTIKTCTIASCAASITVYATAQTVLTNQLRVRGDFVYWASTTGVYRCPVSACAQPEQLATISSSTALALDDAGIFLADRTAEAVVRVPWGGAASTIATGVPDVRALVVQDGFVYFPTYGFPPAESHVYRCATNGCGATPTRLDGTSMGIAAAGVATSATDVYWAEGTAIKRCPLTGCPGEPAKLRSSQLTYSGLALLDGQLYAGTAGSGVFTRCSASACADTAVESELGSQFQGMDHDATHVYIVASSAPNDGRILRITR